MAKNDLDKREYDKQYCSNDCPYKEKSKCDLYFESFGSYYDDWNCGRIYERCKKCIKDIVPSPNTQLIKLTTETNDLLKLLINEIKKSNCK